MLIPSRLRLVRRFELSSLAQYDKNSPYLYGLFFLFLAMWAVVVFAKNGVRNVAVRDKLYWAVVVA